MKLSHKLAVLSWLAPVLVLPLASCGYHVAGKADLVPKNIHTIAIPPFGNTTLRYKLTDRLPEALSQEFIARTRYQIINDPSQADAVLRGAVVNFIAYPILFDQVTGRASGLQVNVTMQVSLTERATGKVIFSRPNYEYHDRYEVSVTNTNQYFEESGPALERLCHSVARDVVTSILDNF
ncbi:MAG TPA: LPS assembly lipoprotein LptE [Bryobacteraceae bacterium]|nr:LPS assembly lipoprotein LptE [Bryobacteraceae bacterium]